MIDTLKLTTTGSVDRSLLINLWEPPITHHHDHDGLIAYNTYRYVYGDNYSPKLQYTAESRKVTVSIPSLPRFAFGNSSIAIDDNAVPFVLDKVYRYVVDAGVEDLPDITTWEVSSADLSYDFHVGDDVKNYLDAFKKIKLSNYKQVTYSDETVAWRSNSGHREIRSYDRHTNCVDKEEDPITTSMSQGVIRFEVGVRKSDFYNTIGRADIGSIFRSDVILPMLDSYLNRLSLDNLRITTKREIRTALTRAYGHKRAATIIHYLEDQAQGVDHNLHRSTIWRYKRDLQNLGIAPVIGIRRLPPLRITGIPNTQERLAEAEG